MNGGLPVLATVNKDNDLQKLIESEGVGRVCTDYNADTLARKATELVSELSNEKNMLAERCIALSERLFSPAVAVKGIVEALKG
jgi:hypothetical protein